MTNPPRYIGLMSGTSMDAVDAVLLEIDNDKVQLLAHLATPMPTNLRANLHKLSHPGEDSVDLLGQVDGEVAALFANAALSLLAQENLTSERITAIGSHGQTIRHRPNGTSPFSIQIGDPNRIAALTGITTVADFRRKDMALGGEGAPLVPAFHHQVFGHSEHHRAVINIGGIANITWLPAGNSVESVTGFDTGPGNGLMDAWIQRHLGKLFDDGGLWAASGTVQPEFLDILLVEPYFQRPAPKSTGKELFNLPWLDAQLARHNTHLAAEDVQATLCEFTARTIAAGLNLINARPSEIYLCGGGAFNCQLHTRLEQLLPGSAIATTAAMGIDPQHVEAAAFAWLAHRTLNRLPGNLPAVTGASRGAILGGIYLP